MDEFPKEYLDEMDREAKSSARMLGLIVALIVITVGLVVGWIW